MESLLSVSQSDIESSAPVDGSPEDAPLIDRDGEVLLPPETGNTIRSRVSRRWKTAVAAIKLSTSTTTPTYSAPGAFDDRYNRIHEDVTITCVDYNATTCSVKEGLTNDNLEEFLRKPRPPHSKVRWLHIDGVSFDIMQILANKYQLHPLAVEDIFHTPQRIKVDYYSNHLYISIVLLTHRRRDQTSGGAPNISSPHTQGANGITGVLSTLPGVQILISQASLLMTSDSTLITVTAESAKLSASRNHPAVATLARLRTQGTLLRSCEDASFLLHAVLDAAVDSALPVVDAFTSRVGGLESEILAGTLDVALTRELHLISADLTLLRRILAPLAGLISALRKNDPETAAAGGAGGAATAAAAGAGAGTATAAPHRRWLSPLAATYMFDVQDHVTSALENLDILSRQCRDAIDLVFNMLSFQTNMAMKALAILSTVFLPITFVAGVYGTNFQTVREYKWEHGFYGYFWGLNLTIVLLMLVGMWMAGLIGVPVVGGRWKAMVRGQARGRRALERAGMRAADSAASLSQHWLGGSANGRA